MGRLQDRVCIIAGVAMPVDGGYVAGPPLMPVQAAVN